MAPDRPSADFGRTLRDARERRGVTLRQIANATKISVAALEALERNDFSRLPGGIFTRAFVRSYAIEVGLDPDQTVQDFLAHLPQETAVAVARPQAVQVEDGEALERDRRMASTFLRLIALSVPLAGLVIYLSASGRIARPHEPPAEAAAQPAAPAPAPPTSIVDRDAAFPPSDRVPAPTVKPPAANPVPPAAERPAAAVPDAAQSTTGRDDARSLTVVLSATRPCWLSATVDGHKKIERLLTVGEQETLEVGRELTLTAGDASAIRMTINGADARPLGKVDQVVTARVNLSNYRSFLLNR